LKIKGLKNTLLVQHTKLKQKNTLLVQHTKLKQKNTLLVLHTKLKQKNTLLVLHTKLKQKNTLLVLHTKLKPCLLTNFHNNMINRPEYIKQLNDFKDTKIIKVITGMRRLKIIMKK
jgi:hypothetical protein